MQNTINWQQESSSSQYPNKKYTIMLKEVKGLKCPHHDLIRDDHHFRYQEAYPGARPLESTRCMRCGFTMSLHKVQR